MQRHMMFIANNGVETTVHRYEDTEMAEVFGPRLVALDKQGFLETRTGLWIDMDRAAKKRAGQIKMALNA